MNTTEMATAEKETNVAVLFLSTKEMNAVFISFAD